MFQKNEVVIEALMKWRSLTLDVLKIIAGEGESDGAFRKRIYRMEMGGLLKSKLQQRSSKLVYLSEAVLKRVGLTSMNEESIKHDATVAKVGVALQSAFPRIKELKLPHELQTKASWKHHPIIPDSILEFKKDNRIIRIALEVELWRKDRKRVFDKFIDYTKATEYHNVFYFFGDRSSYESYKKRLEELLSNPKFSHWKEELEKKFLFIVSPTILTKIEKIEEFEVFHDSKLKRLGDLLG